MVSDEEEKEENIVEEASEWDGTFEPVMVIDSDECSFVVTGLEESSYGDFVLNIELENKSSEGTYSFDLIDLSINGITGTGIYYEDLTPGEKITDVVDLSVWNDLEEAGIEDIEAVTDLIAIQFDFRAVKVEDFTDYFNETCSLNLQLY